MEQIARGASQRETTTTARAEAVRVGVDLAKRVIQVHGVDANGRVGAARALARDKFLGWLKHGVRSCNQTNPQLILN